VINLVDGPLTKAEGIESTCRLIAAIRAFIKTVTIVRGTSELKMAIAAGAPT
jgi:hypothetical protein